MNRIKQSLDQLEQYMVGEQFSGYDPYDALLSPLFRMPGIRKAKKMRFLGQQFCKRFPLNLRPVLFVPKGCNPVTLGLAIQGYAYLTRVYPEKKTYYLAQIDQLIDRLKKDIPSGFSGACWGYDFDWQARHADIPAYQPTVVATGIITNGLYECWKITGNQECADLVVSASRFVTKDLNRTAMGDTFCYSYSPFDKQTVLNASMKGVRILAQTYSITRDESLLFEALPAVNYVMDYQQPNGSFVYSKKGQWVDNYHTGYVLDCLDEFELHFGSQGFEEQLRKGYTFYKDHFFTAEGIPRFYDVKTYPVDCTAAGQSLLTLVRFGDLELAEKVANWMTSHMQSRKGNFYFRKYKAYTVRTSFMRWSNAWMFVGMAWLLFNQQERHEQ